MVSKAIYFIDSWVKANIGPHCASHDAACLARQCIEDAAKAGLTNRQLEDDLGTDLVDFISSELRANLARRPQPIDAFKGPAHFDTSAGSPARQPANASLIA